MTMRCNLRHRQQKFVTLVSSAEKLSNQNRKEFRGCRFLSAIPIRTRISSTIWRPISSSGTPMFGWIDGRSNPTPFFREGDTCALPSPELCGCPRKGLEFQWVLQPCLLNPALLNCRLDCLLLIGVLDFLNYFWGNMKNIRAQSSE